MASRTRTCHGRAVRILTPDSCLLTPSSIQRDPIVLILRGHIGKDHLMPHLQAVDNLDHVHRAAPEVNDNAGSGLAVFVQLEQTHAGTGLAEDRTSDVSHALQMCDLDSSIHAQIRYCTGEKLPLKSAVDGTCSIHHVRIDAHHSGLHDAVARIDLRSLTDGY